MNKNVGKTDKAVRIVAAAVIGGLGIYFQSCWGLLANIPHATAHNCW